MKTIARRSPLKDGRSAREKLAGVPGMLDLRMQTLRMPEWNP
ncbi:hypothetical protein QWZ10_13410 [Paracoccus cavernae]|uniref:Uncharacterized protein n=1 Tax=Paracoccus cavernae TaxID=1571207 RepID=A0ABT8D836_9RHOB|nr:hypothetical protein [Paracoccus cavernae]